METCSVNVTKSKTNTCLCTTKLCAKIKCDVLQKDCNQLTVFCKMKTIPANHHVCLNYSVINDLRGERTPRTKCTFMNHFMTLRNQTKNENIFCDNELKRFSFNLSWFFKDSIDSIKLCKLMLARKHNSGKYLTHSSNWNVCTWNTFKIWSVSSILKEEKIFFSSKCTAF